MDGGAAAQAKRGLKTGPQVYFISFSRSANVSIPVDAGDFRLMTRSISDLIVQMPERDRFIRGMVASVGFKQVPFCYDRQERYAGSTKYPVVKTIKFAADAFLGYSMILLRFSAMAALVLLLALIGLAVYSMYGWLYLDVTPGWTRL